MLSPDSGGLHNGLEVKNLLNLAIAFTPGFGSFLTLWAVPSFIHPPRVAWLGVGRGTGGWL